MEGNVVQTISMECSGGNDNGLDVDEGVDACEMGGEGPYGL